MANRTFTFTRRQVLRGSYGTVVGLPFLPSLVAAPALAEVAPANRTFLFAMCTRHGGVLDSNMYPADALLTESKTLFSGHQIRWGALSGARDGSDVKLSNIVRAPGTLLNDRLLGKINILRGVDVPWECMHNSGCHLGNYARNDGNGTDGKKMQAYPTPTIDQIIGLSPGFYPSVAGIRKRVMYNDGGLKPLSYTFSDLTQRTGVSEASTVANPAQLFEDIFVPPAGSPVPMPQPAKRKPIVDRILTNYNSLRQSNRRLSQADKERLDAHISRLADLEKRLAVADEAAPAAASCAERRKPATVQADTRDFYKLMTEVYVTAFLCGTSRVGVLGVRAAEFADDQGNWHQGVAHRWDQPDAQAKMVQAKNRVFGQVFLPTIAALDAIEYAPGSTYLDQTLLTWTEEGGEATHSCVSRPIFTAGAAGGRFRTGVYIDYRNRNARYTKYGKLRGLLGLTHNQFLATIVQKFGVSPNEWKPIKNMGKAGWGFDFTAPDIGSVYAQGVVSGADAPLPIWAD